MPKLTDHSVDDGVGAASLWHRFVEQRFPRSGARKALRKALRCSVNREQTEPTRVWLVGGPASGKSLLLRIVRRTCESLGVKHVAFQEGPEDPFEGDPNEYPMVIWTTHLGTRRPASRAEGWDHISIDMTSEVVERTQDLAGRVSTLDVLRWLGEGSKAN